jgi:hypothetical protein
LLEAVMDGQADMETNEGVGRRVGCLCCDWWFVMILYSATVFSTFSINNMSWW